MDLEQLARDVVDVLLPIVDVIGAPIGVGVVVTFAAYVLSELRIRPPAVRGHPPAPGSLPGPRP
ncbi:MAG: hypothetical protein M3P39_03025 [Actinomycetota bacterium]|nr:hypothetical protein [Actinomycetota bacterium]